MRRAGVRADGPPVVAFHGVAGHLAGEPTLAALAAAGCRVFAPVWPGFGDQPGEVLLEDMLDFALHGADVVPRSVSSARTSTAIRSAG